MGSSVQRIATSALIAACALFLACSPGSGHEKKPDGTVIQEQVSYQVAVSSNGYVEGKLWYILREDYEVVPGDWTVSLLHGRKVLLEQHFEVAAPQ